MKSFIKSSGIILAQLWHENIIQHMYVQWEMSFKFILIKKIGFRRNRLAWREAYWRSNILSSVFRPQLHQALVNRFDAHSKAIFRRVINAV